VANNALPLQVLSDAGERIVTDLQERLAKALGWKSERKPSCTDDGCLVCQSWLTPDDVHELAPAIDWRIVPVILAECERLGWDWQMGRTTGFPGGKISHWAVIRNSTMPMPMGDGDTPPEALAEAFCRAREANDRPD
jgi:hypothetical protein